MAFWQRTCPEWYQVLQLDSCLPLSLCQCVPCHLQKTNKIGQSAKKTGCSKLHTGFPDAPSYPRDTNKNSFMVSECIRRVKLKYHGFTNAGRWNPSHLQVPCEGSRSVLLAGPKAAVPKIAATYPWHLLHVQNQQVVHLDPFGASNLEEHG